jgi:CSLREA domain-containing protein
MKTSHRLPLVAVLLALFIGIAAITQLQAIGTTATAQQPTLIPPSIPEVVATPLPDDGSIQKLVVTKLEDTDDGSCDPDDCSLREAIKSISKVGQIRFSENVRGTLLLSATLEIDNSVAISGPGSKSDDVVIKTNQIFDSFYVSSTGILKLTRLTITARDDLRVGGTVLVEEGTLIVEESTFRGIRGQSAILNVRGNARVERSLFRDNDATVGAAIQNISGSVIVINSTFTNNHSTHAGAIFRGRPKSIMKE